MLDPVALPRRTAYLPRDDVVFEPVDFIVLQTRETCLEAAEQLLVGEIRADAFERTHDERHRRTGKQVGLVREEHRDVVPPHRHGERGAVRRNIARRNNEIAVARALVAHLAADIGRGVFALVKGRCRLVEPDAGSVLVRAANGQKRLLRHSGKPCRAGKTARAEVYDFGAAVVALSHARQRAQRLAAGHEHIGQFGVAGDGGGQRHVQRHHDLNDGKLLRRVAEEAVQIDLRAVEHAALREAVPQTGQTVARVGQALVAQAVVHGEQLREVGQLGGKRRVLVELAFLGRAEQGVGRDHTGLALVDERERLAQQLRLVRKAVPRGQTELHAPRRLLKRQKLTRRGEHLLRQTADHRKNTVGKPRKRQHLRRAGAVVVRRRRQTTLHLM